METDLIGASDEQQFAFATSEGRVLITHDDDFLRLHHAAVDHAGIGYCHQTKYSVGDLLQVLILLHGCVAAEEMLNRVEYLQPSCPGEKGTCVIGRHQADCAGNGFVG